MAAAPQQLPSGRTESCTWVIIPCPINLFSFIWEDKTTSQINRKQCLHVIVDTRAGLIEQLLSIESRICLRGGLCVFVRWAEPSLATHHFLLDTLGFATCPTNFLHCFSVHCLLFHVKTLSYRQIVLVNVKQLAIQKK